MAFNRLRLFNSEEKDESVVSPIRKLCYKLTISDVNVHILQRVQISM